MTNEKIKQILLKKHNNPLLLLTVVGISAILSFTIIFVAALKSNEATNRTSFAANDILNSPTSTPSPIQATYQIAYWKFNEAAGTTASDSSGNNNTGTLVNGPIWTTGKLDSALQFDGVNDYVSIGNPSSLNFGTEDFTYSFWVYANSNQSNKHIISKWKWSSAATSNQGIAFTIQSGPWLQVWLGSASSSNAVGSISYSALPLKTWKHITLTRQAGTVKLYIDATQVISKNLTHKINTTTPLTIGGPSDLSKKFFNGAVDEIKIYNRALTDSEILAEYQGVTPAPVSISTSRTTTPASFIINPDKTISINGEKMFPVSMYAICQRYFESKTGPCDPSKNPEFPFTMTTLGTTTWDYENEVKKFEEAGKGFPVLARQIKSFGDDRVKNSPYWYLIRHTVNCAKFPMCDEPDYENIDMRNEIIDNWNNAKALFPQKPVYMNNWRQLFNWLPYVDIYAWDAYVNNNSKLKFFSRDDLIYANELHLASYGFGGKSWNDTRLKNKALWTVLAATVYTDSAGVFPMTRQEARAMAWGSIAYGTQGLAFYGYLTYPDGGPNRTYALYNDPDIRQMYADIANEIKSLNSVLTLPTKAIYWQNNQDESYINVTPNPLKNICTGISKSSCSWWPQQRKFTYLLKQPDVAKSYLIIVNKDKTAASSIQIKVGGLTGIQKVTTLGSETIGSGRAGRILTANNGQFLDNFDGYAVHIYEIASNTSDTILP